MTRTPCPSLRAAFLAPAGCAALFAVACGGGPSSSTGDDDANDDDSTGEACVLQLAFTGTEFDYVSWLDSPWAFGCNLDGPCCQSDGATICDKPLVQAFFEFGPGDTAYVFVAAGAPYELRITGG
jgi:hypothetical protein